jgi:hypothetical protein
MSNISDDNYISMDYGAEVLSFGWYKNTTFWNVNISMRNHLDFNLPGSFFALLKEGFSQNETTSYDLKNISATGNSFLEVGVSYSRPFINNSLTLGLKAKLLGGIADFDLNAEKLTVEAGTDRWRAESQVKLNASAPGIMPKYNSDGILDGFDADIDGSIPGYGVGFDIGAAYDFSQLNLPVLKNLRASVALIDIGFVSWSKKNSIQLKSTLQPVVITSSDYQIHTDGSTSLEGIFEDVTSDLNEAVNLHGEAEKGRTTALRSTLNMGLEYTFLNNKFSAGLLYSNRFGNYFNTQELTLSGNLRPLKWLSASLSYSFMHSNFNTFGGALYITPGKVLQLFIASDYIISHVSPQYIPSTSNALNLQFGVSIPM